MNDESPFFRAMVESGDYGLALFASEFKLDLVSGRPKIYMDGTLKSGPWQFM